MKENQTTIKESFTFSGKGLHTGKFVTTTVKPAVVNNGIKVVRVDCQPPVEVPVSATVVGDCARGTVLNLNGVQISTLEHLLAALHGLRVDNVTIETDGPEVPILDGSARYWAESILRVGIEKQSEERHYARIEKPLHLDCGNGTIYDVIPSEDFQVECTIDFGNSVIGRQTAWLTSYEQFETEIAPCRTFVFLHELEPLLKANLIKGGDLENAIVFVNKPLELEQQRRLAELFNKDIEAFNVTKGVLNTSSLYFENEPARHKLLDFMGDILLVGAPLKGHFKIVCPGHKHNAEFSRLLQENINLKKKEN